MNNLLKKNDYNLFVTLTNTHLTVINKYLIYESILSACQVNLQLRKIHDSTR